VKALSFTTTGTDNAWINNMTIMSSDIAINSVKFTTNFYVSGGDYRYYWMVVKSGVAAPTNAQIKAGSYGTNAANNASIAAKGNASGDSIPSGKSNGYAPSSLAADTNYVVYGVVYSGNAASNIVSATFKTLPSVQYAANLTKLEVSYYNSGDTGAVTAATGFTFAAGTYSYPNVSVPAGTTTLRVTPTPASGTIVKVNGTQQIEPTQSFNIALGSPTVTVRVVVSSTAANITDREYSLTVTVRQPEKASLASLYAVEGSLSPAFSPLTVGYSLELSEGHRGDDAVNLTFGVPDNDTNVKFTSLGPDGAQIATFGPVKGSTAGNAPVRLGLAVSGSAVTTSTINILVEKASAASTTYTITVTRYPSP
jgi:hypothetical protein